MGIDAGGNIGHVSTGREHGGRPGVRGRPAARAGVARSTSAFRGHPATAATTYAPADVPKISSKLSPKAQFLQAADMI